MTKYELRITGECKQNLKICKKRGLPMQELWDIVAKLLRGEKLDEKYIAQRGQSPLCARSLTLCEVQIDLWA